MKKCTLGLDVSCLIIFYICVGDANDAFCMKGWQEILHNHKIITNDLQKIYTLFSKRIGRYVVGRGGGGGEGGGGVK